MRWLINTSTVQPISIILVSWFSWNYLSPLFTCEKKIKWPSCRRKCQQMWEVYQGMPWALWIGSTWLSTETRSNQSQKPVHTWGFGHLQRFRDNPCEHLVSTISQVDFFQKSFRNHAVLLKPDRQSELAWGGAFYICTHMHSHTPASSPWAGVPRHTVEYRTLHLKVCLSRASGWGPVHRDCRAGRTGSIVGPSSNEGTNLSTSQC